MHPTTYLQREDDFSSKTWPNLFPLSSSIINHSFIEDGHDRRFVGSLGIN